jgi:hypothetical protein
MTDQGSSSEDEGTQASVADAQQIQGKPKRWKWSPVDAYFNNIMIVTCCQIIESGDVMSASAIQAQIMDIWHKRSLHSHVINIPLMITTDKWLPIPPPPSSLMIIRYFNTVLHPKPHQLLHPSELYKHTAFEDKDEHRRWLDAPQPLGKPGARNPHCGMKQSYHDFAEKIWAKFKLIRREIANETSVIWANLVPQNHIPSGKNMADVVEKVRSQMFDKWQVQPTSKQSRQVYSKISMEGAYASWKPTWWDTWRALGPPSGKACSQVFMSECCGFPVNVNPDEAQQLPAALLHHYVNQTAVNVNASSRAQCQRQVKEEDRKQKLESDIESRASSESKSASRVAQAQLFLNLEKAKETRKQRADEIDRLKYLISRAKETNSDPTHWQRELDELYTNSIIVSPQFESATSTSSSNSQRSNSKTPFSPIARFDIHSEEIETNDDLGDLEDAIEPFAPKQQINTSMPKQPAEKSVSVTSCILNSVDALSKKVRVQLSMKSGDKAEETRLQQLALDTWTKAVASDFGQPQHQQQQQQPTAGVSAAGYGAAAINPKVVVQEQAVPLAIADATADVAAEPCAKAVAAGQQQQPSVGVFAAGAATAKVVTRKPGISPANACSITDVAANYDEFDVGPPCFFQKWISPDEQRKRVRQLEQQLIYHKELEVVFEIQCVPEDCLLACFAAAFNKAGMLYLASDNTELAFDVDILRQLVAEDILSREQSLQDEDGTIYDSKTWVRCAILQQ